LGIFNLKEKKRIAFSLGCYTHRDEFDEFLELLLNFTNRKELVTPKITTFQELLLGTGVVQDVVDSGAKGSQAHIDVYLEGQRKRCMKKIFKEGVANFNKYVASNVKMKIVGRQQFGLLHIYQDVVLVNNEIKINEIKLFDVTNSTLLSQFIIAPDVVRFHFENFLLGQYDDGV
jgi:hypothetical protein